MPFVDPPEALGSHTRLPFRPNVALALVAAGCFAVGGFMLAVGLRWIGIDGLGGGPLWTLALFGTACLACGVLLAARFMESAMRRRQAAQALPGRPKDYPWPENRVLTDDRPRMLLFDALGILALLPVLALINTPALVEPALIPWPVWFFLGLFDLLALAGVITLARRGLDRARTPAVSLVLERLPIAPGETLRGRLRLARPGPIELELRGVREWGEWRSMGGDRHIHVKTVAFYREPLPAPAEDGRIEIALRTDLPGTALDRIPAVYWELAVRHGGVASAILLPIYGPAAREGADPMSEDSRRPTSRSSGRP